MTPIAKLVFGIDYDKARLTEFAAALAYAEREQVVAGGFLAAGRGAAGRAEGAGRRRAQGPAPGCPGRHPTPRPRARRFAPQAPLAAIASDEEFALVLTRRTADGSHEPVAMIEDSGLVERAIRRAAA